MKTKKLLWTAALTVLLIALCAATAYGASHTAPEGVYFYKLIENDTQAEITGADVSGAVAIPEKLGGKPVAVVGNRAFEYNDNITAVVIPSSVKRIGDSAFGSCHELASAAIPSSVEEIDDFAFAWCGELKKVVIPNGVRVLGYSAFIGCSSLETISIPASVARIEPHLLDECTPKSVVLDADNKNYSLVDHVLFNKAKTTLLQYIGKPGRTAYTVLETVKKIDGTAFSRNETLQKVTLPSGVKCIEEGSFADCINLSSIVLPDKLTDIEELAFAGCRSLVSVQLPATLKNIGDEAFARTGLRSVSIPEKVTFIGLRTFAYCNDMTSFSVAAANTAFSAQGGVLFNKAKTTLVRFPAGKIAEDYTVPATVKRVGSSAFLACGNIRNVVVPKGVTSIGDDAFQTSSLMKVTLPTGLKTIGEASFSSCTQLTELSIPEGVTDICYYAFYGCSRLEIIRLPASVKFIREEVFAQNPSLANITVAAGNQVYSSQGGVLFNKAKTTLIQYPIGNARLFYRVPATVKTILSHAFSGNTLAVVTVAKSVTDIRFEAFGCERTAKIACYKNSPAHKFALKYEQPVLLLDTHAHSFGSWKTTKAANCKAAGTKMRACSVCGAAESKALAKLTAHKAGAWKVTVKPTATAQGKKEQRCTVCGKLLAAKAVPANHTVKLNLTKITLGKTETYTLKAAASVKTTVKWKSSNTKVATVDSKGKIKAVGTGSATITVTTAGGRTASCTVTVKAAPASVKLSKSTLTLAKGKTAALTATLNPSGAASHAKSWTSSNTKAVKVDAKGKVTAVGKGTATVTCKTFNGKTASCKVTVK